MRILGGRGYAEIVTLVIEAISIAMVALPGIAGVQSKNQSVHLNEDLRSARTDCTLRVVIALFRMADCMPLPLIQPFKISVINFSELALGERNQFHLRHQARKKGEFCSSDVRAPTMSGWRCPTAS